MPDACPALPCQLILVRTYSADPFQTSESVDTNLEKPRATCAAAQGMACRNSVPVTRNASSKRFSPSSSLAHPSLVA